jgi:hypothetical protein
MRLSWSQVIDFIRRRDGVLASSFVGVRQSEIDAIQAQYGMILPSTYVDFLRTMGESSGELYPFGQTYVHTFSQLLEQLPPEDYPADRFFKVAFQLEEFAVDSIDVYLDLTRTDGHDAPLVMFETPVEATHASSIEDNLSVAERLVYRIFRRIDVNRKRYGADIMVFGSDLWNGSETKQAALSVLARSGFAAVLPDLRRVGCMTRESASVLISVADAEELVEFELGGDSREAIEEPVRELLAAFPDADLMQPPAERTEEP